MYSFPHNGYTVNLYVTTNIAKRVEIKKSIKLIQVSAIIVYNM